eukprot:CCRYP_014591-RD/>CCRYP_014591-RD protein AED:0.35 eAED:0.35 QI:165/1/1/1/1/1/2/297/136
MKSSELYFLIIVSLAITVFARLADYSGDDCYGLSKRRCKRSPGCSYDSVSGKCLPVGDVSGFPSEEDEDFEDTEVGGDLKALKPPSPNMAPPAGWNRMKSNKNTRSSRMGMQNACACLLPLPSWFSADGGFWCWCI